MENFSLLYSYSFEMLYSGGQKIFLSPIQIVTQSSHALISLNRVLSDIEYFSDLNCDSLCTSSALTKVILIKESELILVKSVYKILKL